MELGAIFRCQTEPERLVPYAREVERLGFTELWVIEDCFFAAGVSAATLALTATGRLSVGIGIMPAVVRNPAVTAMELAAMARYFPGRLLPGFGHGVPAWMRQIGALPSSQLAALEETTVTVRRLLAGEKVTVHGRHADLDEVRLEFPPAVPPPICLGVTREKSLQLSGRVADGTLLCEPSTPDYIRWARSHIDRGRAAAGRSDPHRVTVYVLLGIGETGQAAVRHELADVLARRGETPQFSVPGLMQDIGALIKAHPDPAAMAHALPADWTHTLAATGTPEEVAESITAMAAAGANSIVLNPPFSADMAEQQLKLFARDVLPLLPG